MAKRSQNIESNIQSQTISNFKIQNSKQFVHILQLMGFFLANPAPKNP
jgi:hypothetical protein